MDFARALVKNRNAQPFGDNLKCAGAKGAGVSSTSAATPRVLAQAVDALLGLQKEVAPKITHKQVEQNRRAKAKQLFDQLRILVPGAKDQKNDRNKVLELTVAYVTSIVTGKPMPSVPEVDDSAASPRTGGDDMIFEMEGVGSESKATTAALTDAEKRLSHNEVEQRRRLLAKQHYEELRALLPMSAKADKNGLIELAILYINTHASGRSAPSNMRPCGDNKEEEKHDDGVSVLSSLCSSLNSAAPTMPSTMSESPACVASMASQGFPRACSGEGAAKRPLAGDGEIKNEDDEAKKRRLSSPLMAFSQQPVAACNPKRQGDEESRMQPPAEVDALSLLSMCAVKISESEPNTPLQKPQANAVGVLASSFPAL